MAQFFAVVVCGVGAGPESVIDRGPDVRGLLRRRNRCGRPVYGQRARLDFLPRKVIGGIGNQFFDAGNVVPQRREYARIHAWIVPEESQVAVVR